MKPKVFIDTNVMVDLLTRREPFYIAAKQLFSLVDQGKCKAWLLQSRFLFFIFLRLRHLLNIPKYSIPSNLVSFFIS